MTSFADLSPKDRTFMEQYSYRRSRWSEMAELRKPLGLARGALVTTAALHLPDQPPFDETVRGGDWSYREIPGDVERSEERRVGKECKSRGSREQYKEKQRTPEHGGEGARPQI